MEFSIPITFLKFITLILEIKRVTLTKTFTKDKLKFYMVLSNLKKGRRLIQGMAIKELAGAESSLYQMVIYNPN